MKLTAGMFATVAGLSFQANSPASELSPIKLDAVEVEGPTFAIQVNGESATDLIIKIPRDPVPEEEWSPKLEKRFHDLARLSALERLNSDQKVELDRLVVARRNIHHPRTIDEIIWDLKQQELTENLKKALASYVKFYAR